MRLSSIYLIPAIIFLAGCTSTNSDKNGSGDLKETLRKERISYNQKIYSKAMQVGDLYTAAYAEYGLWVDDTTNPHHLDTLGSLYQKLSLAGPAAKIADLLLAKDPNNTKMLEIKAEAATGRGNLAEAMNIYRQLYEKDKRSKHLFKMASIELQNRDFKALDQTVLDIRNHPTLAKDSIEIPDNQTGETQVVPSKAALVYLEGLIEGEKKNYPQSLKKFREAVTIYPRFIMAQKYIQAMEAAGAQGR